MPTFDIALLTETSRVPFEKLSRFAFALQKQIDDDLFPAWDAHGSVTAFTRAEDVSPAMAQLIIKDNIPDPRLAGFHTIRNGQPYAVVGYSPLWSVDVSHEALEMIVDPRGETLLEGPSPRPSQGMVKFLVEVCDPFGRGQTAYGIEGFLMSNLCMRSYYETSAGFGDFSVRDGLRQPRQLLQGGYVVWFHEPTGWWMQHRFNGAPRIEETDRPDVGGSMREKIDWMTAARFARQRSIPRRKVKGSTVIARKKRCQQIQRHFRRLCRKVGA